MLPSFHHFPNHLRSLKLAAIAPENGWLEYYPLGMGLCSGDMYGPDMAMDCQFGWTTTSSPPVIPGDHHLKTIGIPNTYPVCYMGVEPKIMGKPPNHRFVHRVWNHYFHHAFWGVYCTNPIFGSTSIYLPA